FSACSSFNKAEVISNEKATEVIAKYYNIEKEDVKIYENQNADRKIDFDAQCSVLFSVKKNGSWEPSEGHYGASITKDKSGKYNVEINKY
ncbi:MAG TPA: hypothetical protein VF941_18835, partial [Clostridia bacterium]